MKNEEVKNTLTNDEVSKIYESLDSKGENTNKEALEKAHEETENTSYNNITPIESKGIGTPQVDEETLREAGLSDEYIKELKSLPDVDTTINESENNIETEAEEKSMRVKEFLMEEDGIQLHYLK